MGRPHEASPTDEQIETFCRVYAETHSLRAAAQAAFPGSSRDNSARKGRAMMQEPAVVERLELLAREEDSQLVLYGEPARRKIRRHLWQVAGRCLTDEVDASPASTSRASRLRSELRARHGLRCCHEPAVTDCPSCEQNASALAAVLEQVGAFRFDAKNALGALEQLGKIEGMFVDRKLVGKMGEDEELAGLSSEEILRRILGVCVKQWGSEHVIAVAKELAGEAPGSPASDESPTLQ